MSSLLQYDPKKGLSEIDRILLQGAAARKSMQELSELTNGMVKPAEAGQRVKDILSARDWLSQAEMRLLLIDDIMRLKDNLMSKAVTFNDLDAAKPLISVLTLLDKTLAADKFDMTKAMTEINRAHAQLMLSAISLALERSFLELEIRYPGLRKAELLEVFQMAMPDVVREIESRVPVE